MNRCCWRSSRGSASASSSPVSLSPRPQRLGRTPAHGFNCSMAYPTAKTLASSNVRPTTCTPVGTPRRRETARHIQHRHSTANVERHGHHVLPHGDLLAAHMHPLGHVRNPRIKRWHRQRRRKQDLMRFHQQSDRVVNLAFDRQSFQHRTGGHQFSGHFGEVDRVVGQQLTMLCHRMLHGRSEDRRVVDAGRLHDHLARPRQASRIR